MKSNRKCLCSNKSGGVLLTFDRCCGRYIDHFTDAPAPDAESVMRSRYSAFVLHRDDYLLATWLSSHRPSNLVFDMNIKWLGLDIKATRNIDATHAEVEFVARSRFFGKGERLHELSRFVKENARWFYVDGDLY